LQRLAVGSAYRAAEGNVSMTADFEINVVGKACPLPLIALAKQVRLMAAGQTVGITGNDPIFEESIVELCREKGHEILHTERDGKIVRILIRI
jgi:tRNA 2-thiouridine synthesizing protein A